MHCIVYVQVEIVQSFASYKILTRLKLQNRQNGGEQRIHCGC